MATKETDWEKLAKKVGVNIPKFPIKNCDKCSKKVEDEVELFSAWISSYFDKIFLCDSCRIKFEKLHSQEREKLAKDFLKKKRGK